jgi:Ser/Thr protein kinase RdoA (MazF antagonist)
MKEISLDKPIAHGRTADVHDWDEGHVLKLFHNWFDLESVEYELKIARAVNASGVKAPAVGDLIHVQGRNGLLYERVAGVSMETLFLSRPWMVFVYARRLAELHAQMHDCVFNADIPAQHRRLENKIKAADALSTSLKTTLLKALESMPAGNRVCHGDFHPANVLLTEKDARVIDWIDASRGNPLADVARTTVILLGSAGTSQAPNIFIKLYIKIAHAVYLREYFRLRPGGRDEYYCWLPIVAAARLTEGMPELEKWLVERAENNHLLEIY